MSKLVVDGVGKLFGDARSGIVALEDINLEIAANELAVIVGPSGCGKSTLLNIVAGLDDATTGEVRINGRTITGPGADRGMVFQSYTLFPWLTVLKNVEFGLKIKGVSPRERRKTALRYIELVGLKGFENALPKTLSGGMKQRVAIARVLANRPEVLLMDEPFGALDAHTRVAMQDLLLTVWEQERTTVLFVTHDIDEAVLLADTVYVMSHRPGRIRARVKVNIPRPRDHRLTVSPEFTAIKKEIMEMLWEKA